jgi:stearoyl-CoA desaturase (delta-9 desaturase)
MHREHHAYSDTKDDPHSPINGFFKSYFLSMMYFPKMEFVKDHLRSREMLFFHKHYWKINAAYALTLLVLFGPLGVVVCHFVPAFFSWQGVSVVNAISHSTFDLPSIVGYKNYENKDNSKNLYLIGYLTFGEGWHNNHHADPKNPNFGIHWYELDLISNILNLMSKTKLITFTR